MILLYKEKLKVTAVVHSRTSDWNSGDLVSVPDLAVPLWHHTGLFHFLCFRFSFTWYLGFSFTGVLGCRAQEEMHLGHCSSTYCKAARSIAVMLTLLHVSWLTFLAFTKSTVCAVIYVYSHVVMWDIDMGLKIHRVQFLISLGSRKSWNASALCSSTVWFLVGSHRGTKTKLAVKEMGLPRCLLWCHQLMSFLTLGSVSSLQLKCLFISWEDNSMT